jgi:hypothetical protein
MADSGHRDVTNAPPVRDTQVITSKERKCGVCGVVGHNKRKCPTIVETGEFSNANSFSILYMLIKFSFFRFST